MMRAISRTASDRFTRNTPKTMGTGTVLQSITHELGGCNWYYLRLQGPTIGTTTPSFPPHHDRTTPIPDAKCGTDQPERHHKYHHSGAAGLKAGGGILCNQRGNIGNFPGELGNEG